MSQVNIVVPPFTMEQSIGIEQAYFTPNVMIHFYAKFLRRPHTEDEQAYFTPNVMIHFYAKFLRRPHTEDDLKQGTEGAAKALDLVEKTLRTNRTSQARTSRSQVLPGCLICELRGMWASEIFCNVGRT